MGTHMINIGGIGSCGLSGVLRRLNTPCYIYDSNLTYQSAIFETFINLSPLFIFDKKYYTSPPLFVNRAIRNDNNTAFDIHNFHNDFESDVYEIKSKYDRRLIRLIEVVNSNDNKILIRMMHTIDTYHPEINGNKEMDCIEKWINFYEIINSKYKNIKIILINNEENIVYHKHIRNGIYLINDKEIFNNTNDKLFLLLKDIKYEDL